MFISFSVHSLRLCDSAALAVLYIFKLKTIGDQFFCPAGPRVYGFHILFLEALWLALTSLVALFLLRCYLLVTHFIGFSPNFHHFLLVLSE